MSIKCNDLDPRLYNMRRTVLHSRYLEDQGNDRIDTTPLRGSSVRFPRLRLLDKDFKSDPPKCPTSNNQAITLKPTSQIVKPYPLSTPKFCSEDRFILHKRQYNVEAANYLLTKKITNTLELNKLDVFKQVECLSVKWRKKFMHQLMVKENVIPGVRQKQVLRGSHLSSENKLPGSLAGQPKELWDEEHFQDGIWKSKPRKRPLIGIMDSILDMPGFQTLPHSSFIDWSSKNIIAAAIPEGVTFYDTHVTQTMEPLENLEMAGVSAMKWNHGGDKLVLCTTSGEIKLYSVESQKFLWSVNSVSVLNVTCYIRCVCWSQDDQRIVMGCRGLILIYSANSGRVVKAVIAHTKPLLTLAFSINYRYIVSSASDMNVRIFLWPSMTTFLDITYYEPVKAVAWHPYDSGMLCIGGGLGDASLSLWNVNTSESMSYRLVDFYGAVENLAWNKLSGELVVQWSYWEGLKQYTVMPVLASLDRVVDILPVEKDSRVSAVIWNPDQTQLAIHYDESLSMWNFFGNEYQHQQKHRKQRKGVNAQKDAKPTNFQEFKCFTIR